MKKTLFLSPPTFDGYDGGAGSRYQCKREVKSFWYPTWLAQLSALVPDSKLIDAPAQDGGGETRQVTDHAATEGQDRIPPFNPQIKQLFQQRLQLREVL